MEVVGRILFIEDDTTFSMIMVSYLSRKGYDVQHVSSLKDFSTLKPSISAFDLILLDYRLPDGTADNFLRTNPEFMMVPVIVITSFNDVRTAVQLMKLGVKDYVTKPINQEELLMLIDFHLKEKGRQLKTEQKNISVSDGKSVDFVRGVGEKANQLYKNVDIVAPTDMSVLITGESGTGKEHIARLIHDLSSRSKGPFVAIDCGALSKELAASELFGHVKGSFTGAAQDKKGCFEVADGGTLFLDEIGNLSYEVQIKLLRALQEKTIQPIGSSKNIKVNVRLITATNENLTSSVSEGDFREDIYHRINEFQIKMPSLRERKEDIPAFVEAFLQSANKELNKSVTKVHPFVTEKISSYSWPGNLRELKNTVKKMVLMASSDTLTIEVLPEELLSFRPDSAVFDSETDLKAIQRDNERAKIIEALEKSNFNKSKAAKMLNIDRKTLYLKIEKYKLDI
ncbi:MAG: sigma-54-dependent Fis family transcriptional regulator [Flavobacteriia bacterium 40-80]|nr:MAG: sigma-54-dependent Fis family transcriptional regulator [Flavobacteriia bacterium 40-80]